jgi:hypothetical protein
MVIRTWPVSRKVHRDVIAKWWLGMQHPLLLASTHAFGVDFSPVSMVGAVFGHG